MAKKAQQAAPAVNPLDALAQPAKSASKSKQYPVIQAKSKRRLTVSFLSKHK
jgi:hypothetical protein